MKKLSAPSVISEPEKGTLSKGFSEYRTEALLFCDEVCERELSQQEFFECVFRNVTFQSDCDSCMFVDCIFDHCDFSNADFHETVFRRCEMKMCRMTGTDFSYGRFQDVLMEGCESSYANYACSKWRIASWKDMSFTEAGFMSCSFEDVRVKRCRFINADFNDTKLKDMVFSDSDISGISLNVQNLKGAVMNSSQALACTRLLGITIKD